MKRNERQQLIAENFKETISHLKEVYPEAVVNEKCGFFNRPCYDIKDGDGKMIDKLNEVVQANRILDMLSNLKKSLNYLEGEGILSKEFKDAIICFKDALREETPVLEEKYFS